MESQEDEPHEVIEHKIMKVNGEVGYKRYTRGKLLGKGKRWAMQAASRSATRASA